MAETIKAITDATWPKMKAKAAEMGIAPPVTPTTWAKVHSEINSFADRAAAKVKALTPAAPAPPPPPPPVVAPPPPAPAPPVVSPPPPSGSIPAGVTVAGLGDVWGLRTVAGIVNAPDKTPANSAGSLPPGSRTSSIYGFPLLVITQAASFDRWDFTGWVVSIDSGVPVSFTDCRFQAHPDSGLQALYGGSLSGVSGVSVSLLRCLLDGFTNLPPKSPAEPQPRPAVNLLSVDGALTARRSAFVRASVTTINWDGPGALDLGECYFGCPAQKIFTSAIPELNAHSEVGNMAGGIVTIDRCLVDCADHVADALASNPDAAVTGLLLWQARSRHLVGKVSNSILAIGDLPSFYAMQAGDDVHGIELTFTNNVIQKARYHGQKGGHLAYSGANCRGSGNRDFDTGELIAGLLNPVA